MPSQTDGTWRNGIMLVVLLGVIDGGRRFKTHGGVGIFRIIFGIQIESAYLAVCRLLNIDVSDSLMMEQVVYLKLLLICNWLLLTYLKGGSLQGVV